jgi:hypothetical protein
MFKWLFASALAESAAPVTYPPFTGSLIGKGLITTACGLAGVFLVLFIFFGVIKLLQRVKESDSDSEE